MLPLEHSAILLTFIKLPFVIKTFALSVFEWPLKTRFTVVCVYKLQMWTAMFQMTFHMWNPLLQLVQSTWTTGQQTYWPNTFHMDLGRDQI